MSEINTDTNYINIEASVKSVYFVTRFDSRYVYGFRWNYENNKKIPFRIPYEKFHQRYVISPVQQIDTVYQSPARGKQQHKQEENKMEDMKQYCKSAVEKATAPLLARIAETAAERDQLKAINAELMAALEEISNDNPDELSDRDELIRCAEIARAAIARAKGE